MGPVEPELFAQLLIRKLVLALKPRQRVRIVCAWMTCHMVNVPYSHLNCKPLCDQKRLPVPVTLWHRSRMAKARHFIKAWRKKKGLNQETAAERIGISRTYLSKIESGKKRYDQPFLEAAAAVYGCKPHELISRHPDDPELPEDLWNEIPPDRKPEAIAVLKKYGRAA